MAVVGGTLLTSLGFASLRGVLPVHGLDDSADRVMAVVGGTLLTSLGFASLRAGLLRRPAC